MRHFDTISPMGSYSDEPRRETRGSLLVRMSSMLVVVAVGTWTMLSAGQRYAIEFGAACAAAIVIITVFYVRRLR